MRVRFTRQADRQYLDALNCIRAKNPAGALTVMHRAEAAIAQLREQPDEQPRGQQVLSADSRTR